MHTFKASCETTHIALHCCGLWRQTGITLCSSLCEKW